MGAADLISGLDRTSVEALSRAGLAVQRAHRAAWTWRHGPPDTYHPAGLAALAAVAAAIDQLQQAQTALLDEIMRVLAARLVDVAPQPSATPGPPTAIGGSTPGAAWPWSAPGTASPAVASGSGPAAGEAPETPYRPAASALTGTEVRVAPPATAAADGPDPSDDASSTADASASPPSALPGGDVSPLDTDTRGHADRLNDDILGFGLTPRLRLLDPPQPDPALRGLLRDAIDRWGET